MAGVAQGARLPPATSPVANDNYCNGYLPEKPMDRFLWVINFFATNGFYVVGSLSLQFCAQGILLRTRSNEMIPLDIPVCSSVRYGVLFCQCFQAVWCVFVSAVLGAVAVLRVCF